MATSRFYDPARPEIDVRGIPILTPGGWRLYPAEEWHIGGAAPKDYLAYANPEDRRATAYIAKRPNHWGLRECVTEEIISTIGRMLPLTVAKSRLVRLPSEVTGLRLPQTDVRFLSRNFLREGEVLRHGVELFAEFVGATRAEMAEVFGLGDRQQESRFYTLENAVDVLRWHGRTKECSDSLLRSFGRMLAFDALVGSQDRHSENWGVVEHVTNKEAPRRFAPVYDTARGLLSALDESALWQRFGEPGTPSCEEALRAYAKRSRPVFGCAGVAGRVNHLSLAEYALTMFPETLGESIRQMVTAFDLEEVRREIRRRFGRVITPLRMALVLRLLEIRREMMRRVVEGTR